MGVSNGEGLRSFAFGGGTFFGFWGGVPNRSLGRVGQRLGLEVLAEKLNNNLTRWPVEWETMSPLRNVKERWASTELSFILA